MDDCLFCKIAAGELGGPLIYEDEQVVAFDDISPQAPVHVLIIPRAHYTNLNDEPPAELLSHILQVARKIAQMRGIDQSGYRVVQNNGPDAGQTVFHLHFHVIGGRTLAVGMA